MDQSVGQTLTLFSITEGALSCSKNFQYPKSGRPYVLMFISKITSIGGKGNGTEYVTATQAKPKNRSECLMDRIEIMGEPLMHALITVVCAQLSLTSRVLRLWHFGLSRRQGYRASLARLQCVEIKTCQWVWTSHRIRACRELLLRNLSQRNS